MRILLAQWDAAQINDLPDSSFLYIEPGGKKDDSGKTGPRSLRHFPYKDADGNVDLPHLRNALARIPQSNLPEDVQARCTAQAEKSLAKVNEAKLAGMARGVEILKAGTFSGMGGVKVTITDRDLDEIAANFAAHPDVPMVLGHEEDSPVFKRNLPTDTPAAGWATRLYRSGEVLLADIGDIPELVGNWIKAKAYRKVSAMLMRGADGKKYIGHIGLLGARRPAVGGLSDFPVVSFAGMDGEGGDAAVIVVQDSGGPEGPGGGQKPQGGAVNRAEAVAKLSAMKADPVLFADSVSDAVVVKLAESLVAVATEKQALEVKLADAAKGGASEESVATFKRAKAEADEALGRLAAANKAGRVDRIETVFSTAIKAGRMCPAEAASMKPAALALADQPELIVELASADGKSTRKVSALEALLAGVEMRPQHQLFTEGGEEGEGKGADPRKAQVVKLAEEMYRDSTAIQAAYPAKGLFIENQLLAAGFKAEKPEDKK